MKTEKEVSIRVGDVVKVKGKIYLVFHLKENRVFCRRYRFTKGGRFQYYQDQSFPLYLCKLANESEKKTINEERIQATLQQNPYSSISSNYKRHLIR